MSAAMKALDRLNQSRLSAGDITIPAIDRTNLNAFLANRQANGWTAEDRKQYLAACKAEFDHPTAAGGVQAAIEFWSGKAEEIRRAG